MMRELLCGKDGRSITKSVCLWLLACYCAIGIEGCRKTSSQRGQTQALKAVPLVMRATYRMEDAMDMARSLQFPKTIADIDAITGTSTSVEAGRLGITGLTISYTIEQALADGIIRESPEYGDLRHTDRMIAMYAVVDDWAVAGYFDTHTVVLPMATFRRELEDTMSLLRQTRVGIPDASTTTMPAQRTKPGTFIWTVSSGVLVTNDVPRRTCGFQGQATK